MLKWFKIWYQWRYWPKEILYFPLTLYIILVESLRTKHLFYFAAANPSISLGGFAGDSKKAILDHVPETLKPATILVRKGESFESVKNKMRQFAYPLIAKPDIGEGGFKVKKIDNELDLKQYHQNNPMDYLIQLYCDDAHELTILTYKKGIDFIVSSIVERIPFKVIGDGQATIKILITKSETGVYNKRRIEGLFGDRLATVPEKGELVNAGSIGNWDFGATYKERPELNTIALKKTFDCMMKDIAIFNYARIDFKCKYYHDLEIGKIQILEINGVKGEPVQIYDGKYNLWQAYCIIFENWNIIRLLSLLEIKKGFKCPSTIEGFKILFKHALHKVK